MRKTILAFGETLWDLLPDGRTLGGAPFNFAYRACCLGDRGLIVSRLGRDDLGRQAYHRIVELGMETTFVQWDDHHPTGTVGVSFDAHNNPDYFIVPGVAYDYVQARPQLLSAAAGADCICFGSLSQRSATARRTLQELLEACRDCLKLFDANLRKECFTRQSVDESLRRADILRCNEDETAALGELLGLASRDVPSFCQEVLSRWSLSACLVTLGPRGAYAAGSDGQRVYMPGCKVKVADTLGAGDAFTAGFVHRFLRGADLAACLELGNAVGAMVAAQKGGTEPISMAEVRQFLKAAPQPVWDEAMRRWAGR